MKLILKFLLHACLFIALTLLTQIGGVAYVVALGIAHGARRRIIGMWRRAATLVALSVAIYAVLTLPSCRPWQSGWDARDFPAMPRHFWDAR